MENNNPLPPVTSFKLPDQNPSNSGSLLKAFSIEGITIFLIVLILLFFNYFNILPLSKSVGILSFLPHQAYQNTAATTVNSADMPIPTPTPFSHKIADVPDDNSLIPIFSPDKEHIIFETPEGHDGYTIPDCKVCDNLKIVLAGYSYATGKLLMVGVSNDGLAHIFNDGKEIQILPEFGGLTISGNGQKLATWNHQNGNLTYYVNNTLVAQYPDPERNLIIVDISFSIDASKNGYVLMDPTKKTYRVFVEGKEQPYQGTSFSYAPKGDSYSYIGLSGTNTKFAVLNGVKQNNYLDIGNYVFDDSPGIVWSPDGTKIAYVARKSMGGFTNSVFDSGEVVVVIDGREITGGFRKIKNLTFSPDSKRYAFASSGTNGMEVILDGKSISKTSGVLSEGLNGLFFSPNSERFVYALAGVLFEGDMTGSNFKTYSSTLSDADHINSVIFSNDSKRIAFTKFTKENKQLINIDDKEQPMLGAERVPSFSPDSKHIAFWALDNDFKPEISSDLKSGKLKSIAVLDSKKSTSLFDPYPGAKELLYLYSPSRANTYIPFDNTSFPTKLYDTIRFTDDSRFMKYNAIRGKEYWVIVLDTTTGEEVIDKNTAIPTDVPSESTPTPTGAKIDTTPGFTTYGTKEITSNVTAQVVKMTETDSTVTAEIQIKNSSDTSMTIKALSFQLHSNAHGTGIEASDLPDTIPAHENKIYKAAYKKLPEKPYILKYFKADGKAEELGKLE